MDVCKAEHGYKPIGRGYPSVGTHGGKVKPTSLGKLDVGLPYLYNTHFWGLPLGVLSLLILAPVIWLWAQLEWAGHVPENAGDCQAGHGAFQPALILSWFISPSCVKNFTV